MLQTALHDTCKFWKFRWNSTILTILCTLSIAILSMDFPICLMSRAMITDIITVHYEWQRHNRCGTIIGKIIENEPHVMASMHILYNIHIVYIIHVNCRVCIIGLKSILCVPITTMIKTENIDDWNIFVQRKSNRHSVFTNLENHLNVQNNVFIQTIMFK